MSATLVAPPEAPPERLSFHPGVVPASALDYERQGPLVLPGYTWDHYLSLDELLSGSGVRVRFLNHHIEIMAPISAEHEEKKVHLGRLVDVWCEERDIASFGRGSTTLKREGQAGGEPDESFHFGEVKDRPDLVIEIALSSGGLSKRAFYAEFGVPELWIWRKDALEVYILDPATGSYRASAASEVLPGVDLDALAECTLLPSTSAAIKTFRARIAR